MAMGSSFRDRRRALADHGIALHGIALGKRRIIKDRPAPVVTAREQYFFYAENRNRQRDPGCPRWKTSGGSSFRARWLPELR
jgi:hypothetical protein